VQRVLDSSALRCRDEFAVVSSPPSRVRGRQGLAVAFQRVR
jgi:hypothetical protein